MKTAGAILQEYRENCQKSLSEISRQTRIKEKFLFALETSDWSSLPNFAVAQGFAKNYARVVNANPEHVAALLRRDFPQGVALPRTAEMTLEPPAFWTPKTTILVVAGVTVAILGVYLARQYMLFASPPPLEVFTSKNQSSILVSGKTLSGATVEVAGRTVLVANDGSFTLELSQDEIAGKGISVQATSRTGQKTHIEKAVD